MIDGFGDHGTNDSHLVSNTPDVGKNLADLLAGLAEPLKGVLRTITSQFLVLLS